MIQSMTGFGQSSLDLSDKLIHIEIKSLNSKQLDVHLRIPGLYRDKEIDIRNELNCRLKRGKLDVIIYAEYKEDRAPVQINTGVVRNYYRQVREILESLDVKIHDEPVLQAILRFPEVLNNGQQTVDSEEWDRVMETVAAAADSLEEYRRREGAAIEKDINMRIGLIESMLREIEPFEKERYATLRQKLQNSLFEIVTPDTVDQNRFEQELIYYLEKMDFTEEKTRLIHHCSYFRDTISEVEPTGRKLGFIAQEIGREINTIGSKASHPEIQKIVVLMKDELEKIKEQLLNVL
ncbi:MAG: YicC family protein [Bacteroidales bacterium]|nr:YicC family protein [Bacteroidales bacterium]